MQHPLGVHQHLDAVTLDDLIHRLLELGFGLLQELLFGLLLMNSALVYFGQTGFLPLLIGNVVVGAVVLGLQPYIKRPVNRKIPLAGSRFSPLGEAAAWPMLGFLTKFRADFEARMRKAA